MRILVLNYEYPPLGGGAGVITQNIAERLAEDGNEVTVVTTWYTGENEVTENGSLKIIRLKSKRQHIYKSSVFEMLSWIKQSKQFLKNYLEKEKFDLCFANFAIPGGIVALYLKRKFGLKYTFISHGHDIPWRFPKQMRLFHIATYYRIKRICTESEANFMQTREMKENIDRFIGKVHTAKNLIIPNGVDVRLFKPDNSIKSKTFKVVFIGRLVEQKDPFTFLEAIKIFAETNKNIVVNVIGDGILRTKMEEYINDNRLSDIVKFFGWIPKTEIVKEYQSAHVNVISSVFEGMSVAAFESLACGCFLITTPIDGINEVITQNENGVIVKFHSPKEIAGQLEDYYQKRYLQKYSISDIVIKNLIEKYNWDSIVKKYEKHFNRIAADESIAYN
jgi:glycosyltransferase involved in cell wall biosynthesis